MLRSHTTLASLVLIVGCAWKPVSGPNGIHAYRTRTIEVTNQYRTSIDLYPVFGETTLWTRIARVPPYSNRRIDVPASYLRRDFRIVVCRTSGVLGEANCARTNRLTSSIRVPELVVFPSEHIHAELFG